MHYRIIAAIACGVFYVTHSGGMQQGNPEHKEFDRAILYAHQKQQVSSAGSAANEHNNHGRLASLMRHIIDNCTADYFMTAMNGIASRNPELLAETLKKDTSLLVKCYEKQHEYQQSFFYPEKRIAFNQTTLYREMMAKLQK